MSTTKIDSKIEDLEAKLREARAAKRKAREKTDGNVGRRLREASERYEGLTLRQFVRVVDPDKEMTVADFVATVSAPGFAKTYGEALAAAVVPDDNDDTSVDGSVSEVGNHVASVAATW
ncbi:hypothetical protein ACTXJ8_01710 [Corynebacterium variabile]|uniref:hypothetical protein n=1 Tax=Corynebacterium variabile TaxID=1727 RepID=UPI003FD1A3F0